MTAVLIVANKTLPGPELAAAIASRLAGGRTRFHVVVPVTPINHLLTWDEDESRDAAMARLTAFLEILRTHGASADGELGDPDPIVAARDAMRAFAADEVILSTLPVGLSKWLKLDVPTRLADELSVPVCVVTAAAQANVMP